MKKQTKEMPKFATESESAFQDFPGNQPEVPKWVTWHSQDNLRNFVCEIFAIYYARKRKMKIWIHKDLLQKRYLWISSKNENVNEMYSSLIFYESAQN